jgi:hypothetical protein
VKYDRLVSTDFLDRLATQLKTNKSALCRRAIQRILAVVKKNLEDGKYKNDVEAEADFRQLVDRDEGCRKRCASLVLITTASFPSRRQKSGKTVSGKR